MTNDSLVLAHLPLTRQIARRWAGRVPVPFDDLTQFAALGLIRAAERFDPGRGCRFPGFAWRCMAHAITEGVGRELHAPKRGRGLRAVRPVFRPFADGEEFAAPDSRAAVEAAIDIGGLRGQLAARSMRIALASADGGSYPAIAAAEGITAAKARSLAASAAAAMRRAAGLPEPVRRTA